MPNTTSIPVRLFSPSDRSQGRIRLAFDQVNSPSDYESRCLRRPQMPATVREEGDICACSACDSLRNRLIEALAEEGIDLYSEAERQATPEPRRYVGGFSFLNRSIAARDTVTEDDALLNSLLSTPSSQMPSSNVSSASTSATPTAQTPPAKPSRISRKEVKLVSRLTRIQGRPLRTTPRIIKFWEPNANEYRTPTIEKPLSYVETNEEYRIIQQITFLRISRTLAPWVGSGVLSSGDVCALARQTGGRRNRNEQPLPPETPMQRVRKQPLTPAVFKYDRAVGVEIECFGPIVSEDSLPIWVRATEDGSINAPSGQRAVEFRVLLKRSELEPRLFRLCSMLKNHKVNKSCGLHVHLDARQWDSKEAERRGRRLAKWLSVLSELVPTSRRENTYCKEGFSASDRYHAVNFTAYEKHRTIEVRLHSGTCDYSKIIAWIRLLELLLVVPPPARTGSTVEALTRLPLPDHDRAYWLSRHRKLNPGQYADAQSTDTATSDASE